MNATALNNEMMARHTSWRVGGPADVYFKPDSRDELCEFLRALPVDMPVHWVGLGSNLLIRDGGIRGAVIATNKALSEIRRDGTDTVIAEAGVACTTLARQCARWQLGPAEFFAGIPGTVGGALTMNAGAFGGETWDHVVSVETIDRRGDIRCRARTEFEISYRSVSGPANEWFLSATLKLAPQTEDGLDRIRSLMAERKEKQPIGKASCGSVFRNPPGHHAAQLIDSAGLKGFCIGGAQVSEKHANFIINTGAATAADVEALIEHVRAEVKRCHGVTLVPEVHIVGEPAAEDRS